MTQAPDTIKVTITLEEADVLIGGLRAISDLCGGAIVQENCTGDLNIIVHDIDAKACELLIKLVGHDET